LLGLTQLGQCVVLNRVGLVLDRMKLLAMRHMGLLGNDRRRVGHQPL
jgi:hypothetical protein